MLNAATLAQFTEKERNHRRASNSAALNVGISYGKGSVKPSNLTNKSRHVPLLESLLANKDLKRMASFADGEFQHP